MKKFIFFLILLLFFFTTNSLLNADSFDDLYAEEEAIYYYLEKLVNLVTSPSRHAQTIEEAPAIISVYSARRIKELGFTDLVDVIQSFPGFFTYRDQWWTGDRIYGRGIRGSVLILLDGIPLISQNNPTNISELGLTLDHVERIEVMRGPGSVVWGANAFLGLINIITKTPEYYLKDKDYGGEFTYSVGSWETNKYSGTYAQRFENGITVMAKASAYTTLDYPMKLNGPDMTETISTSDRRNTNHSQNLDLKINYKDYIKFSVLLNNQRNYLQADEWGNVLIDYNYNSELYLPFRLFKFESNQRFFNDTLDITFLMSQFDRKYHWYVIWDVPPMWDYVNWQGNKNDWHRSQQVEFQFDYTGIARNRILLGLNFFKQSQPILNFIELSNPANSPAERYWWLAQGDIYDQGPNDAYIASIFLQNDIEIRENLKFQLGIRHDIHELTEDVTNPKGSIVWNFVENGIFKILYGKGFREPTFNQLFSTSGVLGTAVFPDGPSGHEGNPEYKPNILSPEKSEAIETQITYDFERQNLILSLNYAFSKTDGLIRTTYKQVPASAVADTQWWGYPNNSDKQEIHTLELEGIKSFPNGFSFMMPGSYILFNATHNNIKQYDNATSNWERHNTPFLIYNILGYLRTSSKLSFNFNLHGVQYKSDEYHKSLEDVKGNEYKYSSFHRLDLGANLILYETRSIKTDVSLRIRNVFDKDYSYPGRRSTFPGTNYLFDAHQPGRAYFLELSSRF